MSDKVLRGGPDRARYDRDARVPRPAIDDDSALLKIEVAGICGTDVKLYRNPPTIARGPVIMGHENVGVDRGGRGEVQGSHGLQEGDRVFVEHYVACFNCEWCRLGEYRHCEATDWRTNPDARRFGYTSADNPGTLWGGFSQYMYLPWNAVLHKVPGRRHAPSWPASSCRSPTASSGRC